MIVTHNGKQYTAKKLNDNEWQLTSVKFVSKSKSSGWLNISLPQSWHTVRMVCMNISFLLLGRLKSKRFLAVGE